MQSSLDQVAGPVGEVLVMTALGADLDGFAHDLHAFFTLGQPAPDAACPFGGFDNRDSQPMAEISMTPLIDAATLDERLAEVAMRQPQPELRLVADKDTRYQRLAEVMAAVRTEGLSKLGFVTLPGDGHAAP